MPAAAPAPARIRSAQRLLRAADLALTVICPVHDTLVPSTVAEIGDEPDVFRATNWTAAMPSAPVITFALVPESVLSPKRPTTAPEVSRMNITPIPGTGLS